MKLLSLVGVHVIACRGTQSHALTYIGRLASIYLSFDTRERECKGTKRISERGRKGTRKEDQCEVRVSEMVVLEIGSARGNRGFQE